MLQNTSEEKIPSDISKKNKLPILISYIKPEPDDSIQDFTKTYFRIKKIAVINREELSTLQKASGERAFKKVLDEEGFSSPEQAAKNVFGKAEIVANSLSLKFYLTDQIVDSLQWSIFYLPVAENRFGKKHVFIPQNKQLFSAIKEFTDILIASPDYK